MNNSAREIDHGPGRRAPGLPRKVAAALLALSLLLSGPAARAVEFEIVADSFTVVNQVNISSVTYFQTRTLAPPDPALATQLLTPGGLYFDATYYNVWDRTALSWVKLATGTVEANRVAKTGDFMSGQLTTASTVTVKGDAFSVGGSTLVVKNGKVGVGTLAPAALLDLQGGTGPLLRMSARKNVGSEPNWDLRGDFNSSNFLTLTGNGVAAMQWGDGRANLGGNILNFPSARLSVEGSATILPLVLSTGSAASQEVLRVNSIGSVGVGTTSPATKLHISGSDPVIRLQDTDVGGVDAVYFANVNNRIFLGSSVGITGRKFSIDVGAPDDTVFIDNLGNVGVGTLSPTAKLHVGGTAGVDGIRFPDGTLMTSAGAGSASNLANTVDAVVNADSDANASGAVLLQTGGTDRLHIANGGNVGVGATPGANYRLDVVGDSSSSGGAISAFRSDLAGQRSHLLYGPTGDWYVRSSLPGGKIVIQDSGGDVGIGNSAPTARLHLSSANATASDTVLLVSSGTAAGQELLVVKGDGNVGIGTTGPVSPLTIQATAPTTETSKDSSVSHLTIVGNSLPQTPTAGGPILKFKSALSEEGWFIQSETLGGTKSLKFGEQNVELVRFTSAGNVGIGTTSPSYKLHASGSGAIMGLTSTNSNAEMQFNTTGGSGNWALGVGPGGGTNFNLYSYAAGTTILSVASSGNVGIGTTNPTLGPLQMGSGAYVTAGGVWTNASSRAYKDEIADLPLDKALETLAGLVPVTYHYKANKDERHVGFIAEDVPDFVATTDRKGISAMDIVAVLTKVVKNQQKEIEELKARLDEKAR